MGVNYASVEVAQTVVPESDVLLAVGTRLLLREFSTDNRPTLIHIDADESEIGKNLSTEVGIEADAKTALAQLVQRLRVISPPKPSRQQDIDRYRAAFQDELKELAPDQLGMIKDIRAQLGDDDILLGGMTNVGRVRFAQPNSF